MGFWNVLGSWVQGWKLGDITQSQVFREKVSTTTHLQLRKLSPLDLEDLRSALPHYTQLKYLVVNGNALTGQDAIALLTSGAVDIQMESCSLSDDDAVLMAETLTTGADRLENLSLTGNRTWDVVGFDFA